MPSQGSLSDRAIDQRLRKLAAEMIVPAYDLLRVAGTPAGLHNGFHHLLVTPYPRPGSPVAIPLQRRPAATRDVALSRGAGTARNGDWNR